ncbi:lysoplasmalogenase [Microbacterium luticocti]|uniref:lysoplasmalogenase n=1 Tax=Microbacterium luticocti TaxID=451764 RepID=UPI00056D1C50|nr:lysoplasmalogenase family protein [Microbacterium luticocti]
MPRTVPALRWVGFAPYAMVSAVHVVALAMDATPTAAVTKMLLMPLLAVGVLWAARDRARGIPIALLLAAITLSWLGDETGVFFAFAPEIPGMLLFFGLAHLAYIWLFLRHLTRRSVHGWWLAYAAWWVAMLAVLVPHLGVLTVAVAGYGLVLGGTALSAARCTAITTVGGVFFLASDSILAFRLFLPEAMPDWTSPLVMLTYCLGQGLLAAGVLGALGRSRG